MSRADGPDHEILDEQIRYYRARAAEYDDWYERRGRYDRGEEHRKRWAAELAAVETALDEALRGAAAGRRALELACGTGRWTARIAAVADTVTAIDGAPEALALARERVAREGAAVAARVDWREADLFAWEPDERWDFVFFAFWISHVPANRFAEFWSVVERALAPGGTVFFVDSLYTPQSTATNHELGPADAGLVKRLLDDGRDFRVVKVFRPPGTLRRSLAELGWTGEIEATGEFFVRGRVGPSPTPPARTPFA